MLVPFSYFSRADHCNGALSKYRFSGAISISSFHTTVLCATRACINKLSAFKAWNAGYSKYAMTSNTRFSPLVNVTSNVCDVGPDSGRSMQCGECVHGFSLQGINFAGLLAVQHHRINQAKSINPPKVVCIGCCQRQTVLHCGRCNQRVAQRHLALPP